MVTNSIIALTAVCVAILCGFVNKNFADGYLLSLVTFYVIYSVLRDD